MIRESDAASGRTDGPRPNLSLRERQVLEHLLEGLTNKEIGRKLSISPRTVEKHRNRLKEKLGATSFAEIIRIGVELTAPRTAGGARTNAAATAQPAAAAERGAAPPPTQILILYASRHGHVRELAEAVADGARAVTDCAVTLRRIQPRKTGAQTNRAPVDAAPVHAAPIDAARVNAARINGGSTQNGQTDQTPLHPTIAELADYDVILFGTPDRYGSMAEELRDFLDRAMDLRGTRALLGKVGGAFCSTSIERGDRDAVLRSLHTTLLHLGMVPVGVPFSCLAPETVAKLAAGTPYGATCLVPPRGHRQPSDSELLVGHLQGRHAASVGAAMRRASAGAKPQPRMALPSVAQALHHMPNG